MADYHDEAWWAAQTPGADYRAQQGYWFDMYTRPDAWAGPEHGLAGLLQQERIYEGARAQGIPTNISTAQHNALVAAIAAASSNRASLSALQAAEIQRLGLTDPGVSWTAPRGGGLAVALLAAGAAYLALRR